MQDHIIYRGEFWHTPKDPGPYNVSEHALDVIKDGALVTDKNGKIIFFGPHSEMKYEGQIIDLTGEIIVPGFIDAHVHFPQLDMIGRCARGLLDWLSQHTFPEEGQYAKKEFAELKAGIFINQLIRHGTIAAAIYSSSHPIATDLLFSAAAKSTITAVIGKVSMDQNAPPGLLIPPDVDLRESKTLITKWHGFENRLFYAITPRFALSCSPKLLGGLQSLYKEFPDVYIQTHFAETREECAEVLALYPKHTDYLSVYEMFDLVSTKTLLGHGIYASKSEIERLNTKGAKIVHCPTSNSFLGSGLFPLSSYLDQGHTPAIATDVGAGTSLSMLSTLGEAYKVQKLQGSSISPAYLLYLATLGNAKALAMGDHLGSFAVGKDASFVAIKSDSTPHEHPCDRLLKLYYSESISENMSVYLKGQRQYNL